MLSRIALLAATLVRERATLFELLQNIFHRMPPLWFGPVYGLLRGSQRPKQQICKTLSEYFWLIAKQQTTEADAPSFGDKLDKER
jgi:hypothetical protein